MAPTSPALLPSREPRLNALPWDGYPSSAAPCRMSPLASLSDLSDEESEISHHLSAIYRIRDSEGRIVTVSGDGPLSVRVQSRSSSSPGVAASISPASGESAEFFPQLTPPPMSDVPDDYSIPEERFSTDLSVDSSDTHSTTNSELYERLIGGGSDEDSAVSR